MCYVCLRACTYTHLYKKTIPATFLAVLPILCCFLFLWKQLLGKSISLLFVDLPFPTLFYCKNQLSVQKNKKQKQKKYCIVFLLLKKKLRKKKILQNPLKNLSNGLRIWSKQIPRIGLQENASTI